MLYEVLYKYHIIIMVYEVPYIYWSKTDSLDILKRTLPDKYVNVMRHSINYHNNVEENLKRLLPNDNVNTFI